MFRRLALASSFCFAVATQATAQGVCGTLSPIAGRLRGSATGFLTPSAAFSFETPGAPTPPTSTAGTYSQNGITVTPTALYLGHANTSPYVGYPFTSDALYNFPSFEFTNLLVGFSFNTLLTGVAFNFALTTGNALFTVWNSADVNQFATLATTAADVNPACWWGFQFTTGSFDRLSIALNTSNASMALDSLQVVKLSTVTTPEPSTVALTLVGLGALAVVRKRTRK